MTKVMTVVGTQIEPWLRTFGAGRVLVVRFEDYIAGRAAGLAEVLGFIGAPDHEQIDPGDVAHNAADTKHVATGRWSRPSQTSLYRDLVRPLMPEAVRRHINRAALPKAPPRPRPPTTETAHHLVEVLRLEVQRLGELTRHPTWWNLDHALTRFVEC